MWPLVSRKDKIFIKYTDIDKLKKGDIILFKNNDFILHRILEIKNNKITTKGDNNPESDFHEINADNYFGILFKIHKTRFNLPINSYFLKLYYHYILPFHPLIKIIMKRRNKS